MTYWTQAAGISLVSISNDHCGNMCLRVGFTSDEAMRASSVPGEFEGIPVLREVVGIIELQ